MLLSKVTSEGVRGMKMDYVAIRHCTECMNLMSEMVSSSLCIFDGYQIASLVLLKEG
jgi:hypothetical protein